MQKAAAAAVAERGFYAFVTLEKRKRNGLKWEIVEGKLGLGFG